MGSSRSRRSGRKPSGSACARPPSRTARTSAFVKDDYRTFLRENFTDVAKPGQLVDTGGEVLGEHGGTVDFTIGQRKGLGVALGEPRYVVDIQPATATVVIGKKADLEAKGCVLEDTSFVAGEAPPNGAELQSRCAIGPSRCRQLSHRPRRD